jgi:uncharacterized protein
MDEFRFPRMITFTGKWVDPATIQEYEVCIEDIAHHLSMVCRWVGAVHYFLSVAEHSVVVSKLCDPADALYGLLHDGSEAYLGDLISPVKKYFRQTGVMAYDELEDRVLAVIMRKFGLPAEMPESVKRADEEAWKKEKATLLHGGTGPETLTLTPREAKRLFLDRFKELSGG